VTGLEWIVRKVKKGRQKRREKQEMVISNKQTNKP